jgi:hypothetical protein
MRDIVWWRSDEAKDARAANYLSAMLWMCTDNRRVEFGMGRNPPEWPALFHYDGETDQPFWLECKVPTHARDYMRGCQDSHMNDAAKLLAQS